MHSSNTVYAHNRNSWVSGFTQQSIAQLTGDPRYLRFNVLIREDAKGLPFTYVNACKGSPFSSIILRARVEVRPRLEPWPPSIEDNCGNQ